MAYNYSEEDLVRFLRACAIGADEGQIGVELGQVLVNGDLMREAANALEKLHEERPQEEESRTPEEDLHYNLVRAELHSRQAHDLLYLENGPKRSIWYKTALGRAQSILMTLWKRELRWKS